MPEPPCRPTVSTNSLQSPRPHLAGQHSCSHCFLEVETDMDPSIGTVLEVIVCPVHTCSKQPILSAASMQIVPTSRPTV